MDLLGRAVASGHFPIGATLPIENQLGEQMGVSRRVIREAVKVMTARGVPKTARRYGTLVNPLDDRSLLDADIFSWHKKGDAQVILIFRELVELLSIMMPQAVAAALGRLPSERGALVEKAIGAPER
ncbi:GntR family transcriptional regulator [Alphaproteobacteria bacterium]|nr:GntR family transcriptional regulator [Alphaproteobacteria bacterium]